MALVDYGSDSDESDTASASVSAPPPPPPRARPKQKAIKTLPIALESNGDLVADDGGLRKKRRLDSESDLVKSKGKSSLASFLPPPKHSTPTSTVKSTNESTSLLLPPSTNFFSLPNLSPSLPPPPPPSTVTLSISSAPTVQEPLPPPPTLLDPYPGYWQTKSGIWKVRDPKTDLVWASFYNQHYATNVTNDNVVPKGFESMTSSTTEFDAAKEIQKAHLEKPKIINPRDEVKKVEGDSSETKPQKMISARAKGRHQLSSLLSDAQTNRSDLEDRIARAKANRSAAGAKYGF